MDRWWSWNCSHSCRIWKFCFLVSQYRFSSFLIFRNFLEFSMKFLRIFLENSWKISIIINPPPLHIHHPNHSYNHPHHPNIHNTIPNFNINFLYFSFSIEVCMFFLPLSCMSYIYVYNKTTNSLLVTNGYTKVELF